MISYYATKTWPYCLSAGGVVVDGEKVLLLFRVNDSVKTYHLPKGTLEPGESLENCAKREILEESGAHVQLVGYMGARTVDFQGDNNYYHKTTHYYVAKLNSPELSNIDDEHSGREWLSFSDAKKALRLNNNPKNEDEIIERLEQFLALNPQND